MKKLIVITGPTASGKTALSIQLAQFYNCEIVNADSRQFYREMNIGTAKPSPEELKRVKHHFIDCLSVLDQYNIGKFESEALELIDRLFANSGYAILTGGSGLYIHAVCEGLNDLPESSSEVRKELTLVYSTFGIEALQQKLLEADPEHFHKIDIHNPQRVMRALEMIYASGKKISEINKGGKKIRNFEVKKIGILTERAELYDRINKRVDEMMNKGLLEEVKGLIAYKETNALQTVGYKELFSYLEGKLTLPEAIDLIKQNTRNYAKRQMTWFRKDPGIRWFSPDETDKMKSFISG